MLPTVFQLLKVCPFVVGSANIGAHFISAKNFSKSFLFLQMQQPTTYCEAVLLMENDSLHKHYHDHQYGFPINDDNELFARLILEINQAGLSWTTILKKKENFYRAFHNFDIATVANYNDEDFARLMNDAGIIRNRLKISATIHNAQVVLGLQKEFGSFQQWLQHQHPRLLPEWMKVFKQTFRFTGGEIVNEFLVSTGYLPGAHISSCKVFEKVLQQQPMWVKGKG
jgi:DNA-3-methyladenine glycosylase I